MTCPGLFNFFCVFSRVKFQFYLIGRISLFSLCFLLLTKYFYHTAPWLLWLEHAIGADWKMHLGVGFLLTLSLAVTLQVSRYSAFTQSGYFAVVALLFCADECVQYFVSHRTFYLPDMGWSLLGLLLAAAVWAISLNVYRLAAKR